MSYFYIEEPYKAKPAFLRLANQNFDNLRIDQLLNNLYDNNTTAILNFDENLTEKQCMSATKLDLFVIAGSSQLFVTNLFYESLVESIGKQGKWLKAQLNYQHTTIDGYVLFIKDLPFTLVDVNKTIWKYNNYAEKLTAYMPFHYWPNHIVQISSENPTITIGRDPLDDKIYINEQLKKQISKCKVNAKVKSIFRMHKIIGYGGFDNPDAGRNCGFRISDKLIHQGISAENFVNHPQGNFLDKYYITVIEAEIDWRDNPTFCPKLVLKLSAKDSSSSDQLLTFENLTAEEGVHLPSFTEVVDLESRINDFILNSYNNKVMMIGVIDEFDQSCAEINRLIVKYDKCTITDIETAQVTEVELSRF